MADFDAFISKIRALHTNLGDDSEEEKNIADQIAQSLKKQWDKPPTKELEVTHRNLVDDQVRQMLFFPGPDRIRRLQECKRWNGSSRSPVPDTVMYGLKDACARFRISPRKKRRQKGFRVLPERTNALLAYL